ncbi:MULTISPECIES: Lrp/AsnC family transcriptional regulator [Candidatus Nitrosocaldus]|uniref:Transcriptional regulator, AsnC family n=1 Tax=Candidatus Nitrosocaldus cavascurensis TaxID=2058097 RepID=A0A2K5AST4_9ARCH
MNRLDELDLKILYELVNDASISVPEMSRKIGANTSVIYSRIKRLLKLGVIKKYTIIMDESKLGVNINAIVGINRDPKAKQHVYEEIKNIPQVTNISEVSGRFDMLVSIGVKNLEELHNVVINRIGKIDGILNTETFVELHKSENKAVYVKSLLEQQKQKVVLE